MPPNISDRPQNWDELNEPTDDEDEDEDEDEQDQADDEDDDGEPLPPPPPPGIPAHDAPSPTASDRIGSEPACANVRSDQNPP